MGCGFFFSLLQKDQGVVGVYVYVTGPGFLCVGLSMKISYSGVFWYCFLLFGGLCVLGDELRVSRMVGVSIVFQAFFLFFLI